MGLPPWANSVLSAKIPGWRAKGEGQTLEFKEDFPEQAHHLGEEVAAFATCGNGAILLGVYDNGDMAGLKAVSATERDKLIHRAQGIIRTVKPQVKHELDLAYDEGELIIVIEIHNQDEPVFYYDGRPYIRDGRMSRPAEPEEVKKQVWAHGCSEDERKWNALLYEQQRGFVESMRANREDFQRRHGE